MSITLVKWSPCYRIIPTRYPPISIYERVANSDEFEQLVALESQTNPRIKNQLSSIASNQSIYGTGASYVMAAFTHWNPAGSRFSDGTYGVYYTTKNLETAIFETKYHQETFYKSTENNKTLSLDMRVLTAELNGELEDLRKSSDQSLFTDDYFAPQEYARELKSNGSNGILYMSVRHPKNEAAAVFKPELLANCKREETYLVYQWDGERISSYSENKKFF